MSPRGKHTDLAERSRALSANLAGYHGPEGMPVYDRPGMAGGSRGGAPIWVMREAWMPSPCSCGTDGPAIGSSWDCARHGPRRRLSKLMAKREAADGLKNLLRLSRDTVEKNSGGQRGAVDPARNAADPDGFAVFGRYPKGFRAHVMKAGLLGRVARDEVLHVCSGTLSETEKWTVDIRAEARPRVQASGTALPFRTESFKAVMLDPPYSDEYARNLYKVENPRPSWLLREAVRVVVPGGRIGILHVAVPFSPPGCRLVNVWGISTGVGFRMRAFTVYEKEQGGLFDTTPPPPPA